MKISEARQCYSAQIQSYREYQTKLAKKKQELEDKMNAVPNGMEIYQAAKNIGAMMQQKKKEKYDSLWDEEEEENECVNPSEAADNTEAFSEGPAIEEIPDVVVISDETE